MENGATLSGARSLNIDEATATVLRVHCGMGHGVHVGKVCPKVEFPIDDILKIGRSHWMGSTSGTSRAAGTGHSSVNPTIPQGN
jgi:hypothetical protein